LIDSVETLRSGNGNFQRDRPRDGGGSYNYIDECSLIRVTIDNQKPRKQNNSAQGIAQNNEWTLRIPDEGIEWITSECSAWQRTDNIVSEVWACKGQGIAGLWAKYIWQSQIGRTERYTKIVREVH